MKRRKPRVAQQITSTTDLCKRAIDKLRVIAYERGIRFVDVFNVYDKLRSHVVTISQFERGLGLCTKLSRGEQDAIIQSYSVKRNGVNMVDYAAFSKKIDEVLLFSELTAHPFNSGAEFLSKIRSNNEKELKAQNQLSEQDQKILAGTISYIRSYANDFGVLMKPSFRDQDPLRTGTVRIHHYASTLSTVGMELSQKEMKLLVWKYASAKDAQRVNYMSFLKDVFAAAPQSSDDLKPFSAPPPSLKPVMETKQASSADLLSALLTRVQPKIRNTQFALLDTLRDFDGLRKNAIHSSKLHSALFLVPKLKLSTADMQLVCQYYPSAKFPPKVDYKMFLNAVLSHKPPSVKSMSSQLSEADRAHLKAALARLRGTESTRVYPKSFFKDFDRRNNRAFTGVVTPQQFMGVLKNQLNVSVPMRDLVLLCKYYMKGDMINYTAFCRDIAPKRVTKSKQAPLLVRRKITRKVKTKTLADVMRKLRTTALHACLHVVSIFKDFDTLRSGNVTAPVFRRCLATAHMPVSSSELELLLARYRTKSKHSMVDYVTFSRDIDQVYGMGDKFRAWKAEDDDVSEDEDEEDTAKYEKLMTRLAANASTYGIMVKPHFKGFDRNNNGCVTKPKFRSVLSTFPPLMVNPDEWGLIWKRFRHAWEINYAKFCEELGRFDAQRRKAALHTTDARTTKSKKIVRNKASDTSQKEATIDNILQKMKNVVYLLRVDLRDTCLDFDSLRTGRVSKSILRRCLNSCGFALTKEQSDILVSWCASKKKLYSASANYTKLCDALDVVIMPSSLHTAPTREVKAFRPFKDVIVKIPELIRLAESTLVRLAAIVNKKRMVMHHLFRDYDRHHHGVVSKFRFRCVLTMLSLDVSDNEMDALAHLFQKGDNMDYMKFLQVVHRQ